MTLPKCGWLAIIRVEIRCVCAQNYAHTSAERLASLRQFLCITLRSNGGVALLLYDDDGVLSRPIQELELFDGSLGVG